MKKHYTLNLDVDTVELARRWADREGRNFSNLVNWVLEREAGKALAGGQFDVEAYVQRKARKK